MRRSTASSWRSPTAAVHAATISSACTERTRAVPARGHGSDLRLEVPASTGLEAILWPVLESARELLADPSRIKECEGEECGWVFVDATKSGTRRWCSMASCGARAKMKRYRARPQRSRSS